MTEISKPKHTLLIGNFGDKNIGDELILSEALESYPQSIVMTNDTESSHLFCEKEFATIPPLPTGFRSLLQFIRTPAKREAYTQIAPQIKTVVFAGGGLFAIKTKAYLIWFFTFLWIRFFFPTAVIRFEHQGVDTPTNFLSKFIVRYVFSRAQFISVRDVPSKDVLEDILEKDIQNMGDRVQFQKYNTVPHTPKKPTKILLNALAPFSLPFLKEILDELFPDFGYTLTFVAFHPSDKKVAQSMKIKPILPKTRTEILNLFLDTDIVIGERFHCILLGKNLCGETNTFTLRKPYSEKVATFCDRFHIIPIEDCDSFS